MGAVPVGPGDTPAFGLQNCSILNTTQAQSAWQQGQ